MKNKLLSFAAVVFCFITSSLIPAYIADPPFVAYKPQVLVTPDNLPVLSWNNSDVDPEVDPSKLNKLHLCTPDTCPQ